MIEAVRYALILGGFVVIGFNLSVILHAPYLVYAVTAWRLYLTGNSIFTLFVCTSLYAHLHSRLTWRLPLAVIGVTITILALILLSREYRRRRAAAFNP